MGTYRGFVIVAERTEMGFHIRASNGSEFLDIRDPAADEAEAVLVAQGRIDQMLAGSGKLEPTRQERNRA